MFDLVTAGEGSQVERKGIFKGAYVVTYFGIIWDEHNIGPWKWSAVIRLVQAASIVTNLI